MESLIRKIFFYSQLVWHHVVYVGSVTEPERFHSNLGATYFNLGNFTKAIEQLEKSEKARHSKDSGFARYNAYYLALSFMNLEEYRKATVCLEEYPRFRPNDDYVKEAVSWCQAQLGAEKQQEMFYGKSLLRKVYPRSLLYPSLDDSAAPPCCGAKRIGNIVELSLPSGSPCCF